MNWQWLRLAPWLDTRARFVAGLPPQSRLLDLGSSDGETIRHFRELRPDLTLFAADIGGTPEAYPPGTAFARLDLCRDNLPWEEDYFDGVTCMHLVEHLDALDNLMSNLHRVLRRGACAYVETPHPKTVDLPSPAGSDAGRFTFNFYDDPTHKAPVPTGRLARAAQEHDLETVQSGVSRNWLFAGLRPFAAAFRDTRQRYTIKAHWVGWSVFIILRKRLKPTLARSVPEAGRAEDRNSATGAMEDGAGIRRQ